MLDDGVSYELSYVLVYLFIISYESNQRITSITLFYTSIDEIMFLFYFMQTESFIYLLEIMIILT